MAARQNSQKLVNKVSFASGEGKADRLFLGYLKDSYSERASGHVITVYNNFANGHSGGSTIESG